MFRNCLKTAFRTLLKYKGFTIINVLGLAVGLGTCLLILTYVFDELSYDRYNTKADRIYRVNNDIKFGGNDNSYAVVPAPVADAIRKELPEVEQVVRLADRGGAKVRKGNQQLQEDKMIYADSTLFDIFSLPMIAGDPHTALRDPYSVVITERTAQKYFGRTDVAGQVLTFNDSTPYKVTGVIKNIPAPSHFHEDFFLSMSTLGESREEAWLVPNFSTYLLLRPGADQARLEAKLPGFLKRHAGPQLAGMLHQSFESFEQAGNSIRLNLTPLKKIHLESDRIGELGINGHLQYVYIFGAIALFILLLACINFMNLSTARSAGRAREVGVRKVLGSSRLALIGQFLAESLIVTFAGAILAVIGAHACLPLFNSMSGKELAVTPQLAAWLVPALLATVVLTGLVAGSYPAFFLSRFRPIEVLKGRLSTGFKGSRLRNTLVIFQFGISIFLIIGTMVIYNQLSYIQSRDLGYSRDHVLIVQQVSALGEKAGTFKEAVRQIAGVQDATLSGFLPTSGYDNIIPLFKDPAFDPKRALKSQIWYVDEDWVSTLGIKMMAGRNFSKDMGTDSTAMILNEAAAQLLGYADPLDQKLYEPQDNMGTTMKAFHIVGVMKNFNFKSLREHVTPLILLIRQDNRSLSMRIRTADIPGVLAQVRNKWAALSTNQPLVYSFMDQDFDALYRSERRMGSLFISFTILASLIACLGLFGLAAYAMEQRTGEIVIRKVLGASIPSIAGLLSKDFIKLVGIAILLASPIAFFVMRIWLRDFAYRQPIAWWVFAAAGGGAILVACITVSFQSIKAAFLNPADGLRNE